MKSLVIVESPTKAKTINRFLPKNYKVASCNGHVRDLPASAKEVPAKYKKEKWANLGINVENDYAPLYVVPSSKKKTVKQLKEELKDTDELLLATDEDREGESISWHLLELLQPGIPVKRMVFHEITKSAIEHALEDYRDVDMNLVQAQETRRLIDRLAGYTISPLLWKKVAPGLSAGRVQSVAVKFLVERERARMRFHRAGYWHLNATLTRQSQTEKPFSADLTHVNDRRVAEGKDFDDKTGKLKKPGSVVLLDQQEAERLSALWQEGSWHIIEVESKEQKRSPAPPFITSTLQQEANRKLGLSARDTMRIAQRLYEQGFITYMRTDSTTLSGQAIQAARSAVEQMYGEQYLFERVRTYDKKAKGAQEAHEAIRPAGEQFQTPQKTGLQSMEFKLYDMIWKRTMATQMADARLQFTTATIDVQPARRQDAGGVDEAAADGDGAGERGRFRASGKRILFPGFFRAYVEGSDDPESELEDQEKTLPDFEQDESLACRDITPVEHETKPPARYTEASLVKELENQGVGRPSTYATIIGTIQERGYVGKQGSSLIPTFTAFAVTELLEKHFQDLVDAGFTSEMEERLDDIARGEEDPLQYLKSYYEGENGLKNIVETQESQIDPQQARRIDLPLDLNSYQIFIGKFGPYVQEQNGSDEKVSTSIPVDWSPADVTTQKIQELIRVSESGPEELGKDPETGKPVYLRTGRYGPYVQLGEQEEGGERPKRVSLLKGMKPEDVDLQLALNLLSLPRTLGKHPETGKDVRAGVGRYGPFVVHDGTFKSLGKEDDVLTVELDRALELLSQAKTGKKGSSSSVLKELGTHPDDGQQINVMTGRYGPYIKYGKTNISLPKSVDPESVSKEDALERIKEKMSA